MIWRKPSHQRIAQIADFFTVISGFIISFLIWKLLYNFNLFSIPRPFSPENVHFIFIIFIAILYVIYFKYYKAYSYQRFTSLLTEYSVILKTSFIMVLLSVFLSFMFLDKNISRTIFILSFITIIILLGIEKTIMVYVARIIRRSGYDRRRIIIVGTGPRAENFIKTVKLNFGWGLDIIGIVSADKEKVGRCYYGFNVLGTFDNFEQLLKELNPEEVIVTISTRNFEKLRFVLETCEKVGISVRLNSDFFGHIAKQVQVENVYGLNIISFSYTKQNEIDLFIKRLIDIIGSSLMLIILSPLLLTIAIIIYLSDGRPILYNWNIMGYKRKPLRSWKFRTMVKNADELKANLNEKNEMSGPVFKVTNDPRILKIGHFLRKYSLDELPQLFSVLKGDLSLVGPRPPLQTEYRDFDLWHRRKLSVKPGITCLWQISGRNNISNFDDWARLDLEYIDHWSILLDIKILLKTIPAVLSGRGAK